MRTTLLLLSLLISTLPFNAMAGEQHYAVATGPVPVLNTPDFRAVFGGKDGRTLQKDRCGQVRAVEFVALPGTVFTITGELKKGARTIYRVTSNDYPYPSVGGYFLDAASVRVENVRPPDRKAKLPQKEEILAALRQRTGTGYVWGGNLAGGVSELTAWYPPGSTAGLSKRELKTWQLAGVDCSGLLYEATGGYTPRNTSALIGYGHAIPIAGRSAADIAALLQPLDLIVWPGHVLIALDEGKVIESRQVCNRPEEGVRIRRTEDALADIMKSRRPAGRITSGSREFVVRRWYKEVP